MFNATERTAGPQRAFGESEKKKEARRSRPKDGNARPSGDLQEWHLLVFT